MGAFRFMCKGGHIFKAEGSYSQFDMARPCIEKPHGCAEQAFMLVDQIPAMNLATVHADAKAYMEHNVTYTGDTLYYKQQPNEHALQCGCDGCRGHRKRAGVTGTAEPMRRNKRVAKEVRT